MLEVSLQPVPYQQVQVVLNGQTCAMSVYAKNQCMFFDLAVNGTQIISAVECSNLVSLVPTSYLGFSGFLLFMDTQGSSDPVYTGLGSRWVLLYLTQAEAAAYGL